MEEKGKLMDFLVAHKDDRRTMSLLRQGLNADTEMRAWEILGRIGGIGMSREAMSIRLVAGCYALHPFHREDVGNMGSVCRRLCDSTEKPWDCDVPPGPMARHFSHLLQADRKELFRLLPNFIKRAKQESIPVDYAALRQDILDWPKCRESWAVSFWSPPLKKKKVEESKGEKR